MIDYKTYIFLIVVVVLSSFLRFHRLNQVYVFNLDEEYQATYAWTEVLHPHLIWIGLPAAAIEFYLGPYLTYFTAILLAFSKGDPIIMAYFAASLGAVTTATIFLIGKKLFNFTAGVITASLYAALPLFVFYDQKFWNTMLTPLIGILLLLIVNLTRKSKWWWVAFAGLAGAIFEAHLLPVTLLTLGVWYFFKDKYWRDIKLLIFCAVAFLIFYWPLIVFDLNHDFSNLKVITRFFSGQKSSVNPTAKLMTLFDSLGRFWYLRPGTPNADEINFGCSSLALSTGYQEINKYSKRTYSPIWLSLISLSLLLFFIFKNINSKNFSKKSLALFLLIGGLSFLIYSGGAYEYYCLVLLTLFTFVPAIFISQLSEKIKPIAYGLILIVIFSGINSVLKTSDEFSLGPKKILISKVMDIVRGESFSIDGRGICHNYEGWRYLFKVYGRTPNQSYTDGTLGWLYPKEISKNSPTYTIILSEDRIPLDENLSRLPSIKEGGYRAYIKKNL